MLPPPFQIIGLALPAPPPPSLRSYAYVYVHESQTHLNGATLSRKTYHPLTFKQTARSASS